MWLEIKHKYDLDQNHHVVESIRRKMVDMFDESAPYWYYNDLIYLNTETYERGSIYDHRQNTIYHVFRDPKIERFIRKQKLNKIL